jgi:hypothetical protein
MRRQEPIAIGSVGVAIVKDFKAARWPTSISSEHGVARGIAGLLLRRFALSASCLAKPAVVLRDLQFLGLQELRLVTICYVHPNSPRHGPDECSKRTAELPRPGFLPDLHPRSYQ